MKTKTTDTRKFEDRKGDTHPPYPIQPNKSNLAIAPKLTTESCPFRGLIKAWIESCRADGLAERTISDYHDKLFKFWWWWDHHYAAELGAHPKNVSTKEARAFASYLREPQSFRWGITHPANNKSSQSISLSPASISSYGRTVKVFFNWLEREGYIEQTPFNKSVKFTNRHKQDRLKNVSSEDLSLIFAALTRAERLKTYNGCRDLSIIALLLDSGVRRGELLSLKLINIELDKRRCRVKGKTGERWAMFSPACLEALSCYLELYRSLQGDTPYNELWLTEDGRPLSYYGFGSLIRRLEKSSGVDFHAHKLRHSFATMMAAQGVNVFDLKEMLGHQSITTTQIYVQQDLERLSLIHKANSPLTTMVKENGGDKQVFTGMRRRRGRPRKEN